MLAVSPEWLVCNGWSVPTAGQTLAHDASIQQDAVDTEAARQSAKPDALKRAENNFFKMCASVFGDLQKRGFAELTQAIETLTATDAQAGIVASIKLLAIDAEAKREGGLNWWDDAAWHPEVEQ